MVHNGHTFDLNVKEVYRLTKVQEKYQIRKPHHLHAHKLKALMRFNPYALVVDYLVLIHPKYVPVRDAFDESMCFDYNYYVFGWKHSVEAIRELMQ